MKGNHPTIRLTTVEQERVFTPALLLAAVPTDPDGATDSWTQLLKTGEFWDPRYGTFSVTTETLDSIVRNFTRFDKAVPGDYDHSFAESGDSRASGWVKELQVRDTQLWGLVSWTTVAADQIRSGEYRYISPEFSFDYRTETGEPIGPTLVAFGLTNRPFLEGMAEVSLAAAPDGTVLLTRPARAPHPTKEPLVDLKKLAEALGLPPDSTEEVVLAAIRAQREGDNVTLTKAEHQKLVDTAQEAVRLAEDARVQARDAVLTKAEAEGKIPPAHRVAWTAAYDADADGTVKALAEMKPLTGLRPIGGTGESILPPEVKPDAPHGDQIHALALSKQRERPDLSYTDAVREAYRELPKEVAA